MRGPSDLVGVSALVSGWLVACVAVSTTFSIPDADLSNWVRTSLTASLSAVVWVSVKASNTSTFSSKVAIGPPSRAAILLRILLVSIVCSTS